MFLCMFLMTAVASAQNTSARRDTVRLSLRQCMERAMSANLDLREAQLELDGALVDRFEADMLRWIPHFTVSGEASVTKDAVGGLEEFDTSWDNFGPYWELDIEIAQPLTTFGQISNLRQASRHGVAARQAGLTVRRAEVASEVYRLYYGVLLARELQRILDDVTSKLDRARRKVRQMLQEGSDEVTTADRAKLDVYAFELERRKFEAEKTVALALGALKRATGILYDTPFDIEAGRLRPIPEQLPPLDTLQAQALQQRPEIRQVEEAVEARRLQVAAAEAERFPRIFLGGRFNYHQAPGRELQYENPWVSDSYNRFSGGIGLGLDYSVDISRREAKIRRARVTYREMLRKRAWARSSIALDVQRAYLEAAESLNNGRIGRRSRRAGAALVLQTFELYDMGLASTRDLLEAYGTYSKSQSDYYQTLYDQYLSFAELYRAIGRPIWEAGQMLDPPQD